MAPPAGAARVVRARREPDERGADRRELPRHPAGVRLSRLPRPLREADAVRAARRGIGGPRAHGELRDDARRRRSAGSTSATRTRSTSRSAGSPATRSRTMRRARASSSPRPSAGCGRISATTRKLGVVGRRLALFLAACLVVPALALAAEGDPKKRIIPADQKKAAAIVLKRADLSAGWKRLPYTGRRRRPPVPRLPPQRVGSDVDGGVVLGVRAHGWGGSSPRSRVCTDLPRTRSRRGRGTSSLHSCTALRTPCVRTSSPSGGKATIVKQGRIAFPRVAPRTVAFRVRPA